MCSGYVCMCYLLLIGPNEDYIPIGEDPGSGLYPFHRCQHNKVCAEIEIIDDDKLEGNEFFTFNLSVKTNGNAITFAPDQMTGIVHIKDSGLSTAFDTLVTTPILCYEGHLLPITLAVHVISAIIALTQLIIISPSIHFRGYLSYIY